MCNHEVHQQRKDEKWWAYKCSEINELKRQLVEKDKEIAALKVKLK